MDFDKTKMQRLMLWLKEHGATFPAITIPNMEHGGRETIAGAPIKAGALVLHIPRSLMISVDVAKASRIGQLITAHNPDISYHGYLAAYLLDTKRNGGFWAPYVDALPPTFPEHPLFFSESELDYLKGSYALRVVRRHKEWLKREYKQLHACLPEDQMFSREEHAWALVNVLTRAFSTRFSGQKTHSMMPMSDMPNHITVPNLHWESESSRGFFLTAAHDIEAGAPLTIRYWKESNALTFAIYGFCLETNPYDVAEIHLPSLPPSHPNIEFAKELGSTRDGMRVFKVPADCDDNRTSALFSYLRLLAQTDYSSVNHAKEGYGIALDSPTLHKCEPAVLATLIHACQQRLQQFDTSIEEDEKLLGGGALPLKLQFAVRVRHGEKVILKYFLNLAETTSSLNSMDSLNSVP